MSIWSYISGVIEVEPFGRTQAEKTYILNTVLDHLPVVTGSEDDMNVYVIQKNGTNCSSSCDEFGCSTNNLVNCYGSKDRKYGWLETQSEYLLIVDASLRDRYYEETFKSFNKWLNRLAKRISVNKVLVSIRDYSHEYLINDNSNYGEMYEHTDNWCDYLKWEWED